jgi:hypothetical protein
LLIFFFSAYFQDFVDHTPPCSSLLGSGKELCWLEFVVENKKFQTNKLILVLVLKILSFFFFLFVVLKKGSDNSETQKGVGAKQVNSAVSF